nr:ScpA family protein [uncultured Sphingomonas sp.]
MSLLPEPGEEVLQLTLGEWEGPLDLLLNLARAQKVDLHRISILTLVEQYLSYLENARALRLEIAADYLVMAAWLAYLKSCLLVPKDPAQDPSPDELAALLQLRLQRLDAMREAGARLMARDRLGRDVFARGAPEGLRQVRTSRWQVSLFELAAAYGQLRARSAPVMHVVARRAVVTLEEAIDRVSALVGTAIDWTDLQRFLEPTTDPDRARSSLASSFVAALELARQGRVELRQAEAFGPVELRQARA